MNTIEYFKEQFDQQQSVNGGSTLDAIRKDAFNKFSTMGIPTVRHEEWKYTRISGLFNKDYQLSSGKQAASLTPEDLKEVRLPGYEQANEMVFVNGIYNPSLSTIRSAELVVSLLEEASKGEYKEIISTHLGHSSNYLKDGINALNTAFVHGGAFVEVKRGKKIDAPVYIYNISDARSGNIFSQPRSLVHVSENAELHIVETYVTIGTGESFANQVMEIVVETDAHLEYYKIQNDGRHTNQVSTTHIRQIGKSFIHTVIITLNGNIVRNNLNVILEAAHCESHLYGLYFQEGQGHVDNHTIVDNRQPNCLSNELYKGIMADSSTGVFNGKIFVEPLAQKTNAYQSNKNILLSETATVNTKPQLEIFADDVKCSHGCTVGRLDEEGMFYLRSRGISEKIARSLLLHAYAIDILEHIRPEPIRAYVDHLISERLEF